VGKKEPPGERWDGGRGRGEEGALAGAEAGGLCGWGKRGRLEGRKGEMKG